MPSMARDTLWAASDVACFAVQFPLTTVLWTFGFVLNHEIVVRYTYNEILCVLDSVYFVTGVKWVREGKGSAWPPLWATRVR